MSTSSPDPRRSGAATLLLFAVVAAAILAAIHLTQGTAEVGAADLLRLLTGGGDDQVRSILLASRVPRLVAGVLVGAALGASGAILQTVSRNILASPDTLAVSAGAYLALVAVTVLAVRPPLLAGGAVAFVGGIVAAAVVLGLAGGGGTDPVRLVLAGSAISLALGAVTTALLLLYPERSIGLFAWGQGTLAQNGLAGARQLGPVVIAGLLLALLLSRGLDVLSLGDDAASVLGRHVARTRVLAVLVAVLLAAAAVTLTGPIGFLGLAAPAVVRLLASRIGGLHRHALLVPTAAIVGVVIVVGADVVLRLAFGGAAGVRVPTGVVTTIVGAGFLVALALRVRATSPPSSPALAGARPAGARRRTMVMVVAAILLVAIAVAGLLLGDTMLLAGDLLNWVTGRAGPIVTFVLDTRAPRVLAAALAGAALALAGAVVQAITRNPLAEPGILGVTGGAGVGAIVVITAWPFAGFTALTGGGLVGAALASLMVFGLAMRGGLASNRLILMGLGVSAATAAAVAMLIVATDPYNAAKALTWLSGSTYGRSFGQLVPLGIALAVTLPALLVARRELDLLALDDDTPRLSGLRLGTTRLWLLGLAVVLTAVATAAVGVIGFVGLVAPHAARVLVGARHGAVLPLSALLGGALTCLADLLGRTVIAPGQLPAGLLTAAVGAPYFVWLLWRSTR